jgi:hypothetical protein
MGSTYILRKGDATLSDLADGLSAVDLLTAAGGKWYYCDPTHGTTGGDGKTPATANSSLLTVYNLCRDGYNDGVFFIGKASAYNPSAAFVWEKSYCHLIGLTNSLPGMGQRARIYNTPANDLAVLFTLSGSGCLIQNIQFFDEKDKAEDGACVLVSGDRNHLVNCFAAGMGSAVASGPFSRAGSYSLKVSGSENTLTNCEIGIDTVVRTAANHELIVSGARNKLNGCTIRSNSVTAGKFLVQIDNSAGDLRDVQFNGCKFFNYSSNWATGITDAINIPAAGSTVFCLVDPLCQFYGVGLGVANNVTHVYVTGAAPNAGAGIMTNPTT